MRALSLPADAPSAGEVGGKAHNLHRLREANAAVPPWVAIGTGAFARTVLASVDAGALDAATIRDRITKLEIPDDLRAEVADAVRSLGLDDAPLAVRSSAVGEDAAEASFAGQFETVLGVSMEGLWDAVRRVWASAWSDHAIAYRESRGITAPPRMGVIVQALVNAEAAGVCFTADPLGEAATAVVSAVHGLGEGLVSGELDADTYRVGLDGGVETAVARKDRALRLRPDGTTEWTALDPDRADDSVLSEAQAREIASVARGLEASFGAPQDVEWAIDAARKLWILQARPITALPATSEPANAATAGGERRLWDNSNIVESYAGVTTPLTFSFARGVYEQVYLQFCRVLGVSEPLLAEHRHVFANMLGLVRGRVYYNLLNWYRVLALLPGYTVNRAFMERMMGVREKLDEAPAVPQVAGRWEDTLRTARMVARLVRAQRSLAREVPAFHARVDAALAPLVGADLTGWTADALAALYRDLEEKLLRHWRAPLVNDFFAMIAFGVLVRLVESWLPGEPATLANDLLCGEGGIVSTEPARRVLALAARVAADPRLSHLFADETDDARLLQRLSDDPAFAAFRAELGAHLDRFGDRCADELKLETVTHAEDPSFVLRLIRDYARSGAAPPEGREAEVRAAAEARVRGRLPALRRRVFFTVVGQARARIRDRENLRFERTRVFGAVRRIFVGIGARLADSGRLEAPRDVFWLRVEEVFSHLDGTGATADLRALVALRRAEFAAYGRGPAPPDRFETRGPPADAVAALAPAARAEGDLRGTGCSPGVVRAPVRVVRDPSRAGELAGHILVAERTDPGWTLLFPAVLGVIVQRGSLLSHSAIVARELALPCIVSVPGLMETLRDGEVVEMDGTAGTIVRVEGVR